MPSASQHPGGSNGLGPWAGSWLLETGAGADADKSLPVVPPLGAAHSTEPVRARIAAPVVVKVVVAVIMIFTLLVDESMVPSSYLAGLISSSAYMPVQ